MGLDALLKDVQIAAIVCNQWGDSGKGKFSDYFSSHWADVTARGTGGNNAGHTVVINGREYVLHLVPTGIINDGQGQTTILGNGMVIDIAVLCAELDSLAAQGLSFDHLMVSQDAHVIMPYHVSSDKAHDASQKDGGIGSTGRGIGPAYADKVARRGVTIADLYDPDRLARRITKALSRYTNFSKTDLIKMDFNKDDIISQLKPFADRIKPFVRDTVREMHGFVRQGKKILLEGAQGLLLSIEHGTYPHVTSSDCSINGTASGVGLPAAAIDLPLGVVKFPFMTRVGGGPFPTELGGCDSERYCAEEGKDLKDKRYELVEHKIPFTDKGGCLRYDSRHPRIMDLLNSQDPFLKGVGVRLTAGEYGATTGRPRRTGWTDAVSARYAVGINGPLMILTKTDSLAGAREVKICYGYEDAGGVHDEFSKDEQFLRGAKPRYKTYLGFGEIGDVREYDGLPRSLHEAVADFERFTGGRAAVVSVGADREATIVR